MNWRVGLAVFLILGINFSAIARPKYALSRFSILNVGLNPHDSFATNDLNAEWKFSPSAWRYGNWGGTGWTNGQNLSSTSWNGVAAAATVDAMDARFKQHDVAHRQAWVTWWWMPTNLNAARLSADITLRNGLLSLPNTSHSVWGPIFGSNPGGTSQFINVDYRTSPTFLRYGTSLANYSFGAKPMPYSEYARRQAITAFNAVIAYRLALFN